MNKSRKLNINILVFRFPANVQNVLLHKCINKNKQMKKYKLLTAFFIALFVMGKLQAQDLTHYNLYMQNAYLYNPAFSYNEAGMSAFLNSHQQWVGFEGAPNVNTFGLNGKFTENSGIGLTVSNNQSGMINNFAASVNYAYYAKFSDEHFLRLGAGGGFTNDKLAGANAFTDFTDDQLGSDAFNGSSMSASTGLAYNNKNIEAQFILPQLWYRNAVNLYSIGIVSYNYEVNSRLDIKPSVLARGVRTSPAQFDLNLNATWDNKLWAQGGYRSNNSMVFAFGANIKGLGIGYAYQMNTGQLATAGGGTHEIQLVYNIGDMFKNKKTVVSGKIANITNYQPVGASLIVSENGNEKKSTNSVDSTGTYQVKLKPGRTYTIKAEATEFYIDSIDFAIAKDEKEKTVNVLLTPQKAILQGTVLRKDNQKPVEATIVITNDGQEFTVTTDPTTGKYELKLQSGKTYKFSVQADKYISEEELIDIKVRVTKQEQNFSLEALCRVHGAITDSKDNSKVFATVSIFKEGKLLKTLNTEGSYEELLKKEGYYVMEFKAKNYIVRRKTISLQDELDNVAVNTKLVKLEKGTAFQLGTIGFKTGTAELTDESFETLDKLYEMMNSNPDLRVEIAGHTDSDGAADFNQTISAKRAKACVDYLITEGINATRIESVGYGEVKPLAPNTTPENKAKNRRVEFKFID